MYHFQVQLGICRAPTKEAWYRRFSSFRFHGPARARNAHESPGTAQLFSGLGRRRQPDRFGCRHGGVSFGSTTGQDADRQLQSQLLQ